MPLQHCREIRAKNISISSRKDDSYLELRRKEANRSLVVLLGPDGLDV